MLLMSWAEGEGEAGREKGGDERLVSEDEGRDERRAPDPEGSRSRCADMVVVVVGAVVTSRDDGDGDGDDAVAV